MGNSNGKPILLTDEVNLGHFRLLRVVGKGAFGKVRIVERKDTGLTFALKYIRKDEVVRSESVRNIIRERRMLQHLNHPFLCNLRYSFQDVEYLYIVVDLMNGGDLRFHISRKTFTEDAVRFWIAELACALRYIHEQGIVHRDVKPDNVLLDSDGHVHLADFNVASDLTPAKPLTSKSGTLAYLAPEVYAGRGYRSEVDWWSLGVLFYECIYNKRPFDANNSEALAQLILKGEPAFPVTSPPVSMPCLHAISSLLEKDKAKRIGAAGFGTLTDNPFFRPIDFAALERKEIEPIFCPSSEKTNFDATYDLEELLLEEAPLEARTRKQKPRAELREDATQQEIRADELHRMIETLFEPFNYTLVSENRSPVSSSSSSNRRTDKDITIDTSFTRTQPSQPDPISVTQTSKSGTRTRSSTHSPDGSPPLTMNIDGPILNNATPDLFQLPSRLTGIEATEVQTNTKLRNRPEEVVAGQPQASSKVQKLRGTIRSTSMGGGVQVVLDGQGSWSDMANQSRAMINSPTEQRLLDKPSGMLGFLNRKKGRDRSPKAKEKERGVLGKEGARQIINQG